MKNFYLCIFFLFLVVNVISQQPTIKSWDYRYGGSIDDTPQILIKTTDGGYLLSGNSRSQIGYDKSDSSRGGNDYWIVKTDINGDKLWDKTYGGSNNDLLATAVALPDSGFIIGGYTNSGISGDKTEASYNFSNDFWVLRLDKFGNKIWDRTYGGASADLLRDIIRFPDNTFLLGGLTQSDSTFDMTHHNYGNFDYWVIKIDANGNKIWDNNYGGTNFDFFTTFCKTSNSGFIAAGYSSSPSNNWKTQPSINNTSDYWIIKFDSSGTKLWDKTFGGDSADILSTVISLPGDSLIIAGYSVSGMGFDKSHNNHGGLKSDWWVIKTDPAGNKIWDNVFGGDSAEDDLNNIEVSLNNDLIIFGTSYSNISGDKSENNTFNEEQPWSLAINTSGNKIWDKTLNLYTHSEYAGGLKSRDGCYVYLTYADNDGGDVSQSRNSLRDFWFTEFCPAGIVPVSNFSALSDTICQNSCVHFVNNSQNANTYHWEFPGGSPSSNTSPDPPAICYTNPGSYDVTLIVTNNNSADTLTISSYITVLPQIVFSPIAQTGDTLFSVPGFVSYQWYVDSVIIPGANDYYFIAPYSGDYGVLVTDSNGCTAFSQRLDVVASLNDNNFEKNKFELNYSNGYFNINSPHDFKPEIIIYDLSGKIILGKIFHLQKGDNSISLIDENLSEGIYFVQIMSNHLDATFKLFIK